MKTHANARPRAAALLLAAAALPLTPAFAQTATPDAAPPVAATLPQAAPQSAPAPVAPSAAPAPVVAAPAPVVQAVPPRPAPVAEAAVEPEPVAPVRQAAQARAERPAAATRVAAPAPVAVDVPEAAPAATVPAATAGPVPSQTPFATPTPVVETPPATTRETTVTSERPVLPIVAGGLILLGLILAALNYGRRRRAVARYDNYHASEDATPVDTMPVMAAAAPVVVIDDQVASPVAPQYAVKSDDRPWIGLTLLPLAVGSQGDDMVVQYELTVENAGTVAAEGVRVSSFLIDDRETRDAALGRIAPLGEVQSHIINVAPGGSVPLTTTITINRSQITDGQFLPKVVADAVYPLPGGREGHFAARFAMGIADGNSLTAVDVATEDTMHDDVGARLDDVLERA